MIGHYQYTLLDLLARNLSLVHTNHIFFQFIFEKLKTDSFKFKAHSCESMSPVVISIMTAYIGVYL